MHSLRSLIGNRYYKLVSKLSEKFCMKQIIKNETKCSIGCLIINLLLNFSRCFQCFRFIYQRNIKFQKDIYNDLPFDHVTS